MAFDYDKEEAALRTRPLPWHHRRRVIHGRWKTPIVFLEWLAELTVFWLKRSALIELVGIVAGLSVIIAAWQYMKGGDERRKIRQYQAWQVINLAQGKGGSGGRIDAIRDLLSDSVELSGIDLSKAWMEDASLVNARLIYAKLDSADFRRADFKNATIARGTALGALFSTANLQDARLIDSQFQGAELTGAQLCAANIQEVDFRNADLSASNLVGARIMYSDLRNARISEPFNWRNIETLALSNIYGLRDMPEGFERFAIDSLQAVSFRSRLDWQKLLIDSAAMKPYFDAARARMIRFGSQNPYPCWNLEQLSDSETPSLIPAHPRQNRFKLDTTSILPPQVR